MRVSVAVTTYRHARWIAAALDSVLAQETGFPFEIVVGDDASDDGTRAIVESYARRHPERIRTVLPERTLGDGGKPLFVEVLARCSGELVAWLDGDDAWSDPTKLRRQADFLAAHPQASMVFHDALRVDGDGRPLRPSCAGQPPWVVLADLFRSCCIPAPTPLFRREALLPLPDWYRGMPWGDWPLYLRAAERGAIGYLDRSMAIYRVHRSGMWNGLDRVAQAEGVLDFYRRFDRATGGRHRRLLRDARLPYYADLAILHARRHARLPALAWGARALLGSALQRRADVGRRVLAELAASRRVSRPGAAA